MADEDLLSRMSLLEDIVASLSWQHTIDFHLSEQPAVLLAHSATQDILNNTMTAVVFNTETVDTDSMHSTTVNTSRITPPTPGLYLFTATLTWPASVTGERFIALRRTRGALVEYLYQTWHMAITIVDGRTGQNVSGLIDIQAGDYVELAGYHVAGGTFTLLASNAAANNPLTFGAVWQTRVA